MKWEGQRESDNVEDDRDSSGGGGSPIGMRHISLGGVVIALIASWVLGVNPLTMLGLLQGGAPVQQQVPSARPAGPGGQAGPEDEGKRFVRTILADTEDVW